jgi:hypothetical protein
VASGEPCRSSPSRGQRSALHTEHPAPVFLPISGLRAALRTKGFGMVSFGMVSFGMETGRGQSGVRLPVCARVLYPGFHRTVVVGVEFCRQPRSNVCMRRCRCCPGFRRLCVEEWIFVCAFSVCVSSAFRFSLLERVGGRDSFNDNREHDENVRRFGRSSRHSTQSD